MSDEGRNDEPEYFKNINEYDYVYDEPIEEIKKILGHPAYLRHVIKQVNNFKTELPLDGVILDTITLWEDCGIDKSLQAIASESGWEENLNSSISRVVGGKSVRSEARLKSLEARKLFSFLNTIINDS